MSNILFGIDIAALIDANISPGVLDAVLIKRVPGIRTPGNLTAGTNPTSTSFTARGFIDSYSDDVIDETNVLASDRLITLIGNSIQDFAIPETDDRITIESQTWTIINVSRDPAAATYECQGRL